MMSSLTHPQPRSLAARERRRWTWRVVATYSGGRKAGFQCCVCKSCCQSPIVAPCCGHIIGCSACLECWLATHPSSCPLCHAVSLGRYLKGFEELTSFFRMLECPEILEGTQSSVPFVILDSDAEDFEDLPPFHTSLHTTENAWYCCLCMLDFILLCLIVINCCLIYMSLTSINNNVYQWQPHVFFRDYPEKVDVMILTWKKVRRCKTSTRHACTIA